jgi:hypothetical protein
LGGGAVIVIGGNGLLITTAMLCAFPGEASMTNDMAAEIAHRIVARNAIFSRQDRCN